MTSPTRTDDLQLASDLGPDAVAVLHLAHGAPEPLLGARLPVPEEGLVIGRDDPWLEGALADTRISRQHVRLDPRGSDLDVTDLDSHNGTFVNGEAVRRATLRPGDVLGLGGLLLVYRPSLPRRGRLEPPFVGCSDAMADVVEQVDLVAPRDTTVLLLGESGVGKELLARQLHDRSGASGDFVAVNCGALAAGVLQSELFGHARGAFTGAERAREGLVAAAAGGTLFLDEVAEAPEEVQVALLRLLQERTIRPVGSDSARKVDVRFAAATHRDLATEAAAGRFRSDLLNRLYRWVVRVPPLRERNEDVPLLVHHLARGYAGGPLRVSRDLALRLLTHPWPGNVRELEAVVERLVVSCGPELVPTRWLGDALREAPATPSAPRSAAPPARPVRPEPAVLEALLYDHLGNVKAVAQALGVSRNSLYRWLKEEGLDPAAYRA